MLVFAFQSEIWIAENFNFSVFEDFCLSLSWKYRFSQNVNYAKVQSKTNKYCKFHFDLTRRRLSKSRFKTLGMVPKPKKLYRNTLNYSEKLDKIRNILSSWKYRRLTLIGKIAVLKSLVASQLVYVLSPLRTNAKAIKEVNKLFFSFLWNDKGDKIKRDIMINVYSNGGLKMLDIDSFSKSLKAILN